MWKRYHDFVINHIPHHIRSSSAFVIVVMVMMLPVAVFMSQQQQNDQQHASSSASYPSVYNTKVNASTSSVGDNLVTITTKASNANRYRFYLHGTNKPQPSDASAGQYSPASTPSKDKFLLVGEQTTTKGEASITFYGPRESGKYWVVINVESPSINGIIYGCDWQYHQYTRDAKTQNVISITKDWCNNSSETSFTVTAGGGTSTSDVRITGTLFGDDNGNGKKDSSEKGLAADYRVLGDSGFLLTSGKANSGSYSISLNNSSKYRYYDLMFANVPSCYTTPSSTRITTNYATGLLIQKDVPAATKPSCKSVTPTPSVVAAIPTPKPIVPVYQQVYLKGKVFIDTGIINGKYDYSSGEQVVPNQLLYIYRADCKTCTYKLYTYTTSDSQGNYSVQVAYNKYYNIELPASSQYKFTIPPKGIFILGYDPDYDQPLGLLEK